ncbi:diacylglycerol kinase family protein [Haloglycomyces albus]|uniref:diacylglycerol kinase family protein n=1 Tax=Haloglycomyces albus TaxID=526067 RepID=UPI00046D03CC|nr:diacylglycerol kinase family protein [Haloglycomyces albus]
MKTVVLTLTERSCSDSGPRTQVLHFLDELKRRGLDTELVSASTEREVDPIVERTDARIVIAADSDSQLNAVVGRAVRRLSPPPSQRPEDMRRDRTVPDLPPLAVLPLAETPDLVRELNLPTDPAEVADAVEAGTVQRSDLMRHDGGGVCVNGVRLGGGDKPWSGLINLDESVLTQPGEAILACVIANAGSYRESDGMELVEPDPTDGQLDVAVAVPVTVGRWRKRTRVEVRRGRGRAVAVTPEESAVSLSDGVVDKLSRKRSWWIEPEAAQWMTTTSR